MRFFLVDRITSCPRGGPIEGVKSLAMSEDFLEYHFPGDPVMPGVLLLESLVQLAGWLVAHSSDFADWFLVDRVERCAFHGFVRPGDRVELTVTPAGGDGGRRAFSGTGTLDGRRCLAAEFSGELVPLAELEDPEAQRRHFAVLTRERSPKN
ncbi:MAG: hypothetical protein V1750_11055 [Acidobacteriota bacterium]